MKISFYNSASEKIRVDKTNYLGQATDLNGVLRDNSSIITPIMEVSFSTIPTYNYCYIEEFDRYYFIDDIVATNNGLWEVYMTVDVLMSFKADIYNLKDVRVARNENYIKSIDYSDPAKIINDTYRPYNDVTKVDTIPIEWGGSFDGPRWHFDKYGSFVFLILNSKNQVFQESDPYDLNNFIQSYQYAHCHIFTCNRNIASEILKKAASDDGLASQISKCYFCPITPNTTQTPAGRTVKLNELFDGSSRFSDDTEVYDILYLPEVISDVFKVNNGEFPLFSDKKSFGIYAPFIGFKELSIYRYAYGEYRLYYSWDVYSNICTCHIIGDKFGSDGNKKYKVIESFNCQFAAEIPVGTSNSIEVGMKKEMGTLNIVMGSMQAALGIAKIGAGFSEMTTPSFYKLLGTSQAQGASMVVSGADDLISSIGKIGEGAIAQKTPTIYASSGGGGNTSISVNFSPYLIIMYKESTISDEDYFSKFSKIYGLPCRKILDLNNPYLKGFTICENFLLRGFENSTSNELDKIQTLLQTGIIL